LIDAPAMRRQVNSSDIPEMTVVGIGVFDRQIGAA
jgi:hypothetical protein